MKGLKIAGIVIGAIALIVLIVWAIRRSMIGKDVKTGVANDVIEKAAIDSGIHPQVAQVVASAPDTAAALSSIGAPMNVANAIANGNAVSPSFVASTNLGPVTGSIFGDAITTFVDPISGKIINQKNNGSAGGCVCRDTSNPNGDWYPCPCTSNSPK